MIKCPGACSGDLYCARQNLNLFTQHASKYFASPAEGQGKAFDELYDSEVKQTKLRVIDYVIAGLPAFSFIVGLSIGLVVVAKWEVPSQSNETVVKINE